MHDCIVYGEHTSGFIQDFFLGKGGGEGDVNACKRVHAHMSAHPLGFLN